MRRSDRLTGILIALQGRQRTAADLAGRFEVTRRTILRDIDALCELGVPIVATPGRTGGFRIAEGFWLPPLQFTREEASAVLLALDHLADADASPLGPAHRSAIDKVRAALGPSLSAEVERGLSSLGVQRHDDPVDPAILHLLRTAVENDSWLRIHYAGPGDPTARVILPRAVQLSEGRWYVDAADSLREATRRFRVSRITDAHRCGAPPNASTTIENTARLHTHYGAPSNPLVELRLTRKGNALAADHLDFRGHLVDGIVRFHCPASELPYYARELIRFGPEVTILGPPELRRLVGELLGSLLDHHGSRQENPSKP